MGGGVGVPRSLVVEVPAGAGGRRVVADRQPGLRHRGQRHVVRCAGPAHPGRYPSGFDRVGPHPGPPPRDREREHRVEQLAVGVGLRAVPAPPLPLRVVQAGVPAPVHARAQVDQPPEPRPPDQRRQQVRREHVDREHVGQAVLGRHPPRLPVPDPGVVDDGVERPGRAGLRRDLPHPGQTGQVADNDAGRFRQRRPGVVGPRLVAGVQDDRMSVGGQQPPGHQPEPVARARDEHARHQTPFGAPA